MRAPGQMFFALAVMAGVASADVPPKGHVAGTVFDEVTHQPIAGATAILTSSQQSPTVVAATSDARGRFDFSALPAGSYSVLVLYGDARHNIDGVSVGNDETVAVRATLSLGAEVITIQEKKPVPVTQPRPVSSTVKPMLPYTDSAISSNDWAVGWLLLDVSAAGDVTAFRFLHRPERGLDEIAQKEVWKLRFEPAHDANGAAVASQILWKMEWPAYWWFRERMMVTPVVDQAPDPGGHASGNDEVRNGPRVLMPSNKAGVQLPPCRGSGPLNLDLGSGIGQRRTTVRIYDGKDPKGHPALNQGSAAESGTGMGGKAVYRDCSPPDKVSAQNEPLIERPHK